MGRTRISTLRNELVVALKTARVVAFCAAVLMGSVLHAADGETEGPSFTLDVSSFSQYVWRGLVLTDGPVLQYSTGLAYKGLYFSIWNNVGLDSVNGRKGKFTEIDYEIGYERSVKNANVSVGMIRYTFPGSPYDPADELYVGMGLDTWLSPSAGAYFDVGAGNGAYTTFDAAHSLVILERQSRVVWSLELAGGAGWGSARYNASYFGVRRSALVDFHPTISSTLSLGSRVQLTPTVGYSLLMDKELRGLVVGGGSNLFGGLGLSFEF